MQSTKKIDFEKINNMKKYVFKVNNRNNKTRCYRSSHWRCSVKKVFLKILQNSQENTGDTCNFIKKETLAQVFSCEFCEIFKNTLFTGHPWTTASGDKLIQT